MIVPVILCGGSGTRLWPLSREGSPKQLLPLVTENSMLQDTVLRLECISGAMEPIIICNIADCQAIREQLDAINSSASCLICEPEGRNTAPAVAIAALVAEKSHPDEGALLLILPADHSLAQPAAFSNAVSLAATAAEADSLVTFGVIPDRPETGYGYIKRGAANGGLYAIERFVEKPDAATAEEYVESGEFYWNSGMFMLKASSYLSELESYAPKISHACRQALADSNTEDGALVLDREAFLACPRDSIDYAVMEHTKNGGVVPLDAGWSDVGSWASLHELCEHDEDGNIFIGNTESLGCRQSYIRAENRLVVGIGLDSLVVVETSDAVLIMPKDRAQDVKEIVARLKSADG